MEGFRVSESLDDGEKDVNRVDACCFKCKYIAGMLVAVALYVGKNRYPGTVFQPALTADEESAVRF